MITTEKTETIFTPTSSLSFNSTETSQTNLYKVLYGGLYRLGFRKLRMGMIAATITLSALVFLNAITALNILQHAQVFSAAFLSKSLVVTIGLIVLLTNLYYFHGVTQNKRLLKEVKNEFWYLGDIYAFVYGIVTITLFLETL